MIRKNKTLHVILWLAQILLALLFSMAGGIKIFLSIEELAMKLPWVSDVPEIIVRTLGVTDVLAALGVILPMALGIWRKLTLWALGGMGLTMISAMVFHLSRGEGSVIGFNIVLLALALFVFWGRTKKVPL